MSKNFHSLNQQPSSLEHSIAPITERTFERKRGKSTYRNFKNRMSDSYKEYVEQKELSPETERLYKEFKDKMRKLEE